MFDLNNWEGLSDFIKTLSSSIKRNFSNYRDIDELISLSLAHLPYVATHYNQNKDTKFVYYALFSCRRECVKFIQRQYHERVINIESINLDYLETHDYWQYYDRDSQKFYQDLRDSVSTRDYYENLLRQQLVDQFIQTLPDNLQEGRRMILNQYLDGFPVKEIASIMSLTGSMVYYIIRDFRAFVKEELL